MSHIEMLDKSIERKSKEWWAFKRKKYNLGLLVAGLGAFICYVIVGTIFIMPYDQEFEIILFTTIFQGVGYLIMLSIANIFYGLGYWVDSRLNKNNSLEFRVKLFNAGYWFSICLPFIVPLLVLLQYFTVYKK